MPRHLLYTLLFCHFAMQVFSQTGNYTIQNYNTENGLPQNSVRQIGIDKYGFTWLSTEAGMVRFDGQNFRNFNMANCPPLKHSDRMRLIFTDTAHQLFFLNTAFDIYKISNWNTIEPLTIMEDKPADRKLVDVKGIPFEQQKFEYVFNQILKNCTTCMAGTLQNQFSSKGYFYKLSDDEIYVEARVLEYSEFYYLNLKNGSRKSKRIGSCQAGMYYFSNDTVFTLGSRGTFNACYKSDEASTVITITGDILHDGLYTPALTNISMYGQGQDAFVQLGSNYYALQRLGNSVKTTLLFKNLFIPNVSCIAYNEASRQYFFGTRSDGLFVVKQKTFDNILLPSKDPAAANANVVASQLLLPGDSILINTGAVFGKRGVYKGSSKILLNPFTDSKGNYWCILNTIIYKFTRQHQSLFSMVTSGDDGSGFFSEDKATGIIWHSKKPDSLYRITQENSTGQLHPVAFNTGKSAEISYLQAITNNRVWVGTTNGLYLLSEKPYSLQPIPGSEGKNVRYILADTANDMLWIATYGQGPGYVKNGHYYSLPLDNANNLLSAHCFIPDNRGFFWMPTNHGLFQVYKNDWLQYSRGKKNNVYYQYYNNQEGFASNEFNGGTNMPFIRRSDSLISLPTMKGLVWFYPDRIVPPQPVNNIFIDNIKIDNHDTDVANGLQLPYNYGQLSVAITTPYYGNKENLVLEYQLSGSGETWNEIPNKQIVLSQLPYGKYVLTVRSNAGFGSKYNYADFSFEVLPAWYQSKWFYALMVMLIIAFIILLLRLRIKQLVSSKKKLELEVENRTASLVETLENYELINNKLEQTQQQLLDSDKTKETIIGIILHDLWSPLNYLADTAGRMAGMKEKYSQEEIIKFVQAMAVSTADVTILTENLLKWLRSQKGSFAPQLQLVNVPLMLTDIVKLYRKIATQKGNTLLVDCAENINVPTDPAVLTLMIRNLVDNANKNTANGTIAITVVQDAEHTAIQVSDTGKGLPNDIIQQIMELEGNNQLRPGSLGFRFVFDFAKVIGAVISIEENRQTGFSITVSIPCGVNEKSA